MVTEKLYGRSDEILLLNDSFERITKGAGEIITIPGHSGVGKSSLVMELYEPVKNGNGFFVSGKFEQYQQNIPYFAFRQALSEIFLKLINEEETLRDRYKEEIIQSLGNQGQVLVDLVPQFEQFIGEQPTLGEISPQEARHRFTEVIQNFLFVICKPEHPLVLFLDDWQWADIASIELLRQLRIGRTLKYVLMVVAYRDNEVDKGHLLPPTLDELKANNVQVNEIKISNISKNNIHHLLEDTLTPGVQEIENLSDRVHEITSGNPFFIKSLIDYLAEFEMLHFNETKNQWNWTLTGKNNELTKNVVELFIEKFRNFTEHERKLISRAACLGNRFNINSLAMLTDTDADACKKRLTTAPLNSIVKPFEEKNVQHKSSSGNGSATFIFIHDRMQQAAFLLIPPGELPNLLLSIGRILRHHLSGEELNERIFEVVNHLNYDYQQIKDEQEQLSLIELNLQAARKAYKAIAYNTALKYYRMSDMIIQHNNLQNKLWNNHRGLMMDYCKESAQIEFLEGEVETGEAFIQQAIDNASNTIEKAEVYNILIIQYTLQARYEEAIEAGSQALNELGIHLPDHNFEHARDIEIARVRALMAGKEIASLVHLPTMTDPGMLVASRILITMGPPCYRSHQKLWSVIVPIVVGLTLKHGNIPQIGYSHTAFGGLLAWVQDDYQTAKEFGNLATELMRTKFHSPTEQSVFYLMRGSSIQHWFKHLSFSSQDYTDAYNIGLRSGNLQYAAYAFGHNMYCRFYQGIELQNLIKETQRALEFSKSRHNQWAIDLFEGGLHVMHSITSTCEFQIEEEVEEKYLLGVKKHRNIQVTCIYKVLKTFSLIIKGDLNAALKENEDAAPIIYSVGTQGLLPWAEHVFARFIILSQLITDAESEKKEQWQDELHQILSKLKIWATYCPENYKHKYMLACAEIARIELEYKAAFQLYEEALEAARVGNFIQWEAFINERIYHLWHSFDNAHLAFQYWKQAYIGYKHWGAVAKVKEMEEGYMHYLLERLPEKVLESEELPDNNSIKKWLIENQLKYLERFSQQALESKLNREAINKVDELALATKRLRSEISIRKETEEKVKEQNKELQRINTEKDKFFSIIAHDLKSPFSAILGLSRMLVERIKEKKLEKIEMHAEIIQQSSNKALELLKNLMEWSRSQTGRMVFSPTKFDLTSLIDEMDSLYGTIAGEKNITLHKTFPDELQIEADKPMVSTILRNLISNAIKFTHAEGEIRIVADANHHSVKVCVADNGVGIPEKVQESLFNLDENYSTTGTADEVGTGLGLLLCKEFIDKHNGKIWVESEMGKGSSFYFELPLESESILHS